METCAKSGLLECMDAISFHHYGSWRSIVKHIKLYRKWTERNGAPGMPLWITETGHWRKKSKAYLSLKDDILVAKEIALKTALAKAMGVSKFFPFVFTYYSSDNIEFGMLCRSYAPLRSLSAYFSCVRFLSNKKYVGDFKNSEKYDLCIAFKDKREKCCIVFSPLGKDSPPPLEKKACFGIDGRKIEFQDKSVDSIQDGVFYQLANWDEIKDVIKTGALATASLQYTPKKINLCPIILAPGKLQTENPFYLDNGGYTVKPEGKPITYSFKAINISDSALDFSLGIDNCNFIENASSLSGSYSVAPGKDLEFKISFNLKKGLDFIKQHYLSICGKTSSNEKILPLVISMSLISETLKGRFNPEMVIDTAFRNLKKWNNNKSKNTKLDLMISATQSLQMKASLDGDGWFFPELKLERKLPRDCIVIMLLKSSADKAQTRLMFVYKDGTTFMTRALVPNDGKWRKVILKKNDFINSKRNKGYQEDIDFSKADKIRFGANTRGDKNVKIELGDFLIIQKDEGDKK
jgi:hypothetical protein